MNNALKIFAALLVVWAFFLARETVILRNAPYEQYVRSTKAADPALRPCITLEASKLASGNQPGERGFVDVFAPDYRPICPKPWYSRALDWIR